MYVATFIVSLLIFIVGLLIGITLENERQKFLESQFQEYRDNLENMYLQYALIEQGDFNCSIYPELLHQLYTDLDSTGELLEKYQAEGKFFEPEFKQLKRTYTTTSARTWVLLEKIKTKCPGDYATVLYFYSSDKCDDCESEGVVLDSFKKRYGMKIMIFPIDADYQHPVVHALTTLYNVTTVPTVIINRKIKLEGITPADLLNRTLCESGCPLQ